MNSSKKFTKDIGWKLLSLAIAVGLWFTVINTENPMESRTYTAAIQLQNQESLFERGYVVVNDDELASTRISVRLRGQRLALDRLSQSSTKVQAIVDLNNVIYSYNGEPVSVPVNIVIPSVVNNSFEIIYKSIQNVTVDIQPYINKDFEVKTVVNYDDESVKDLINAAASPSAVTAYGAKSVINSIAEVRAEISPDTLDGDTVVTTAPKAYDAEGNEVSKVTFSSSELSVKISMDDMKAVRIAADVTGKPAHGYEVTEIYVTPNSVDVAGKAGNLSGFGVLRLPDIDINEAEESVITTFEADEYLPDGVRLLGGADGAGTVTVTVTIEKEKTKELVIQPENITDNGTVPEGLFAEVHSGETTVTVSGPESEISAIDADDFKAYVDLSEYEAGTHEDVPLNFILPEGVSVVGDVPTVTVVIS